MKKVYWRPSKISRISLILIAFFAVCALFSVEHFKVEVKQPYYKEKREATSLALKAMQTIKHSALRKKIKIDPEFDPIGFGLIGELMTPITSVTGYLQSKQTSINPNFAAVIVHYLNRVGVKEGDSIAIAMSGSFPAMNICVYAAVQTLKLKPVIISSASASQWGANRTNLSWLDMERELFDKGIFAFKSVAASIGGVGDLGVGMSKKGKNILKKTIEKNEIYFINPDSFDQSIDERISIYKYYADNANYKAYINIGGGTISVGRREGKLSYHPGINRYLPRGASSIHSVMTHFSKEGVPVIHLIKIKDLAARYGFPIMPQTLSPTGEGKIYVRHEYNLLLAIGLLLALLFTLYVFIRSDLGYRIFQSVNSKKKSRSRPEQMV